MKKKVESLGAYEKLKRENENKKQTEKIIILFTTINYYNYFINKRVYICARVREIHTHMYLYMI